jgi:hypothetical protein
MTPLREKHAGAAVAFMAVNSTTCQEAIETRALDRPTLRYSFVIQALPSRWGALGGGGQRAELGFPSRGPVI